MPNNLGNISSLGKEILQALERQRLTKKYLYSKMGISRGTLDNWISGATAPDHTELQKIYEILHINAQKPVHLLRDIIENQDYISMHKRVWEQHALTMETHRELLKDLVATVKNLTQAGSAGQ